MDSHRYKILYKEGEAEISEKKSRFIAHIAPAQTEEEAQAFVEKIKKQYWDARHNCWAYSIGEKQPALECHPQLFRICGGGTYGTAAMQR